MFRESHHNVWMISMMPIGRWLKKIRDDSRESHSRWRI